MFANDNNHVPGEEILSFFGGGDFWLGLLTVILTALIFFNIPTFIAIVRGKGLIATVEMFGASLLYLSLAMTPFTFAVGYAGLWESLKESLS